MANRDDRWGGRDRFSGDWRSGNGDVGDRWRQSSGYGGYGGDSWTGRNTEWGAGYGGGYGRSGNYGQWGGGGNYGYGQNAGAAGGWYGGGYDYGTGRDWDRDVGSGAYGATGRNYGAGNWPYGGYGYSYANDLGGYGGGWNAGTSGNLGQGYGQGWQGERGWQSWGDYGASRADWNPSRWVPEGPGGPGEMGTMGNMGTMGRGTHYGRGPRNWRRSDDRIEEDVNDVLTRHPGIDASDVEVKVSNGEVTLDGEVPDRQQKRLAEDIAESVLGVSDVHNNLKVHRGLLDKLFGHDEERQENRELATTGRNR